MSKPSTFKLNLTLLRGSTVTVEEKGKTTVITFSEDGDFGYRSESYGGGAGGSGQAKVVEHKPNGAGGDGEVRVFTYE